MENPLHSKEEIERIKLETLKEADTLGIKQRFGFFSIPYPATIGDRYYAFKSIPHEKDDRGKVKIKARNPQTTILKLGKSPDVYFTNILKEDPKHIKEKEILLNKEREDYINKIKEKKAEKVFKTTFIPGGLKEKDDYFRFNPWINKDPIYKEPPRTTYYDKEKKKVIINNRNILTNPPKKGTSSFPNILFSYPKSDLKKKVRPKSVIHFIKHDKEEKDFKMPFKPANTHLNGFFLDNRKQYEIPVSMQSKFKDEYSRAKTASKAKYTISTKPNFVKHLNAFKPASGKKDGEQGYFSQRYGVPFVPYIASKRKKEEKDEFSQAFR